MATFSLLSVQEINGPLVSGNWLQNHIGNIESATALAREYEASSTSGQVRVAVVPELPSTTPGLNYWAGRERLDPNPDGRFKHRYEGKLEQALTLREGTSGTKTAITLHNGPDGHLGYSTTLRGVQVPEALRPEMVALKESDRIRIDATSTQRQNPLALEPPTDLRLVSAEVVRAVERTATAEKTTRRANEPGLER